MAVHPDGTVDREPDVTKAKVGFFDEGGGFDRFEKSFVGFMDKHPKFAVVLSAILNIFTGGGLTGAAAAVAETELLEKQGMKGSEALLKGTVAGGAIGRHPIEGGIATGIYDFFRNPTSILDMGKGVYHKIVDKVKGADQAVRHEFAPGHS